MENDRMKSLRTSVPEDIFDAVKAIADAECDGKVAVAARMLIARAVTGEAPGAKPPTADQGDREGWMCALEERLAKTTSRGTKASLATLALDSYMLASLCEILKVIDRDNRSIMRALGLKVNDDSEVAFARIEEFLNRHPSQVFNWAWDAGGRLQAQKGAPNITEAAKGVGFRLSGEAK